MTTDPGAQKRTVRASDPAFADIYGDIPMPEGVTYRKGRREDLQSIQAFSREAEILQNRDYLGDVWCELMSDPSTFVAVAEIDGQVVAVDALTVEPGGIVASGFAGRSHPKYRGVGVFLPCMINAMNYTAQQHPGLKYTAGMTPYVDYWFEWAKKHPEAGYQVVMMLMEHSLAYDQPIDIIKAALHRCRIQDHVSLPLLNSIVRVSRNDLMDILTKQQGFFPNGFINLAIHPFRAKPQNVDFFINALRMPVLAHYENGTSTELVSISFGIIYSCPLGMRYDVAYYSKPGQGEEEAIAHVVHHLGLLVQQHHRHGGSHITTQINYVQDSLDTHVLKRRLAELGLDGGGREPSKVLVHLFGGMAKL